MTRRSVPVLVATLAFASVAEAGPKKRVKIESDPSGATVYFNSKEDGPVCQKTPCTVEAPVGDTPVIVELENHKQLFENLVVSARKPVTVKYKLVPAIGTLIVRGPTGATIEVDGDDKGKAPASLTVPAGTRTVILTLDGKKIATQFVDVPSNDEVTIEGKSPSDSKRKPPPKQVEEPKEEEEEEVSGGGASGGTSGGAAAGVSGVVEPVTPRPARGPYVSLALAMDVGFRNFTYENPETDNLSPEKEGGQVMLGPHAEIYPGTIAGKHWLRGLSLLVRFGYGVNPQPVKQKVSMSDTGATTFWRVFEISLRHRWTIKNAMTLEVGGGYVRDQYQFSGDPDDIELVPDADYNTARFGVRASLLLGSIEPYASIENRLVLSGGAVQDRFDDASATGVRATAGAEAKFGAIGVRVEGALNYYSWSFKSNEMTDRFRATGGTDSIKYISAAVGYSY